MSESCSHVGCVVSGPRDWMHSTEGDVWYCPNHCPEERPPIVLSLCDRTGNMVRPWLDAGHECWIVDLQHPDGEHRDGNLVRVGADVLTWLPPRRDFLFVAAFPPCTDLAVSGARWYRDKGLGALARAAELVDRCRQVCECARFEDVDASTVGRQG